MRRLTLAILLGFVLLPAPQLEAQHRVAPELQELRPGTRVRVLGGAGERIDGKFTTLAGDTLIITGDSGPRVIAAGEIRELRVRRNHWLAGALIGTLPGLAMYAFVDEGDQPTLKAYAAAIAAAGGAVLGALIGLAVPRWPVHYRGGDAQAGTL